MPAQQPNQAKTSPEDQAIFDMLIINGMEMVYDEKQMEGMLARISTNEDPTKAIAEILVDIMIRLVTSAKDAGKMIPSGLVVHGANVLLAEIFKVLEAAGMEPLSEEQATGVWQLATSMYIDQALKAGLMTEQELMAISEEAKQTEVGQEIMKKTAGQAPVTAPAQAPVQAPSPASTAGPAPGIATPQGGI